MSDPTTHPSLIERLKDPEDAAAWRDFEARYRGLLLRYCRRQGLQATDAEDVCQTTWLSLSQSLGRFEYDRAKGRFSHYLGRVVRNAIHHHRHRPATRIQPLPDSVLDALQDADAPADEQWQQEWVDHHYRLALHTVRKRRDAQSVRVFEALLAGRSVAEVAEDFELGVEAVHKVKQRLRDDLRRQIAAQLAEEEGGSPS